MKHAIGPRREMAVRTIFNLLGPLTNPAKAKHQVLGVFDKKWVEPMAYVLKELGSQHVLVVHAKDGLDEISIASETYVAELKEGVVKTYTITPEEFNIERNEIALLAVDNAQESLDIITRVFNGEQGPARDIVFLNAGAAIYAADIADSLSAGIELAAKMLDSGKAKAKLDELIRCTNTIQ
jgi:anthranilate phosphoribosyltransferase